MADASRSLGMLLGSAGAQRACWGIADQVASSITNFSIALAVARYAMPRQFGAFSVALAAYIFLLWVGRSLVSEPYVVRYTGAADEPLQAGPSAVGAAAAIGLASTALLLSCALFAGSGAGIFVVMAVSMPGLLTQDAYRYLFIAAGRARAAAFNDCLWLALQSLAIAVLVATGRVNAVTLTMAFGASAAAAALVAGCQAGVNPSLKSTRQWLRDHRDLGTPFVLELVAINGMTHLTTLVIATIGGMVAVGEIRAAALLMSPPTVLFAGAFLMGTAEAVRLRQQSLKRLSALVGALAVLTSVITVIWAAAIAVLPDAAGRTLLGTNWAAARHLLAPLAALTVANACILSATVGLRALQAARQSLRVRLWAAPFIVASGVIGIQTGGAYGAGVGLAASSGFSAVLTFVAFRRALATEVTGRSAPEDDGDELSPSAVDLPLLNR